MTAAGIILAGGAQQIGASLGPAGLAALAFIVPAAALSWWLGRRSRITHLVILPPLPDDTQPMREIDETIAEFGHDLGQEIEELTRRHGDG